MLYCFDLDGTLVPNFLVKVGGRLTPDADQIFGSPVLLPGRAKKVKELAVEGSAFAIVTNQGGVGLGHRTEGDVHMRIAAAVAQLGNFHGCPFSVHACFAHAKASVATYKQGASRRKPNPAMVSEACFNHLGDEARRSDVVMVGDLEDDRRAARSAGVEFVTADVFFS